MQKTYFEEMHFEGQDFTVKPLPVGEYENCRFTNCDFSNIILSGLDFSECTFENCNLAGATFSNTAFKDAQFKDCKLLGLHWENCNQFIFNVGFDNCNLHLSSFYKMKLKKTLFANCNMHEVDFAESDLTSAVFDNCDLAGAVFDATILEKTDFRTAYNYTINPDINRIKKTRFSKEGIIGLLSKYDIDVS